MDKDGFFEAMNDVGITNYYAHAELWEIARRCADTGGVALGGPFGLIGRTAAPVFLEAGTTVPGWVALALVGYSYGTAVAIGEPMGLREELRRLLH